MKFLELFSELQTIVHEPDTFTSMPCCRAAGEMARYPCTQTSSFGAQTQSDGIYLGS